MCGIAGFVGPESDHVLRSMVAALRHRGPDDEGFHFENGVALGMRRLAIIDLKTGKQPTHSEDGTVTAVFNGEIYNAAELRSELEGLGHRFRSDHSDSEVIIPLFQQYGLDFPNRLRGMFAIAIWDSKARQMVMVRDHSGIKPLYYAQTPDGIVFGSEIKALLKHPAISRDPDFKALHHYFSLKNIPAPSTAYAQIKQLRAGHFLLHDKDTTAIHQWWAPPFDRTLDVGEEEAAEEVRRLIEESVLLHMQSDVPFGAYLSGGVDSSSVVALMARHQDKPVTTFTMVYDDGFANKDLDRDYARQVSQQYQTDHHEFLVNYSDIPKHMEDIQSAFDEPFSGVISTYFITKLIAEHVKVCLSGDGADELFGSYRSIRLAGPLSILANARDTNRSLTKEEQANCGEWSNNIEYLEEVLGQGDFAAQRMASLISDDKKNRALYTLQMLDHISGTSTEDILRSIDGIFSGDDPTNRALNLDFNTLLPDQVLTFVDRLSMAHSVEVRPPFLDAPLMNYVSQLPGALKMKNGRVKHILKESVRGLIPDGILDRPKEGFLMPINHWVLNNLKSYVYDRLHPTRLARHGLLSEAAVNGLLKEHYNGNSNHGNRIWNILNFQLWWDRHID